MTLISGNSSHGFYDRYNSYCIMSPDQSVKDTTPDQPLDPEQVVHFQE